MSRGGFVPGAKIPQTRQEVGPFGALGQSKVMIGDLDGSGGALGRSTALAGFNTESGYSTIGRGMNNPLPTTAAGRTSRLDEGLMAKVADMRGFGAARGPGRTELGGLSKLRGIEGRGTSAAGRTRVMPGPRGGTARGLEGRGVRPRAGTRVRTNVGQKGGDPAMRQAALEMRESARQRRLPVHVPRSTEGIRTGESATFTASRANRGGMLPAVMEKGGSQNKRYLPAIIEKGPGKNLAETTAEKGVRVGAEKGAGFLAKHGRGIGIGLGAAVIAGLAYKGKRGEGSSGGRTQMTRY